MKSQFMRLAICFISLASCFLPSRAFAQQPYYQNKTIRIIRGGEPGGSGDLQARALIPFLKKNIPGDPTIIVENMGTVFTTGRTTAVPAGTPPPYGRLSQLPLDSGYARTHVLRWSRVRYHLKDETS